MLGFTVLSYCDWSILLNVFLRQLKIKRMFCVALEWLEIEDYLNCKLNSPSVYVRWVVTVRRVALKFRFREKNILTTDLAEDTRERSIRFRKFLRRFFYYLCYNILFRNIAVHNTIVWRQYGLHFFYVGRALAYCAKRYFRTTNRRIR